MNKTIISLILPLLLSLMAAGFTSCEGDQAMPPVTIPGELKNPQDPDNPEIGGRIGDGTWQNPLSVYQASLGTKPEGFTDNVWVCGYIVGWVDSSVGTTLNASTARFTSPASVKSNVLLSWFTPEQLEAKGVVRDAEGNVVEDNRWEYTIAVQLVYDTPARPQVNLGDNPGNLGKVVCIQGETNLKYFGEYGLKNTYEYNFGYQGKETRPRVPGVYERVTSFEPGYDYLIVNGSQTAKPLTQERGYLYMTDVNIEDGRLISLTDNVNAFWFEQAEGGIRIRQYDMKYLWADPTDNGAALHTTDNPESVPGSVFTITGNADGTFAIYSPVNGKTLQFDTQYSSFGIYAAVDKALPQLYRQVAK